MNPDGAYFALNYFMQPGTIVEKIHASANPLVVNVLFYFMAGIVIGLLRIRKDTSVADKQSN